MHLLLAALLQLLCVPTDKEGRYPTTTPSIALADGNINPHTHTRSHVHFGRHVCVCVGQCVNDISLG